LFNYFLGAQQAKQMADQAYAQYKDHNRRARKYQEQYEKWKARYNSL